MILFIHDNTNIFFKNDNGIEIIPVESQEITACDSCKSQIRYRIQFINKIKFLFISSLNNNVYYDLLPLNVQLDSLNFKLLYAIIHRFGHFKAIFKLFDNNYLVNDVGQKVVLFPTPTLNKEVVVCAFYYLT